MNDWALYLGMAALLCAACSLLGAGLSRLWGVDPSRETPGAGKKGTGGRLLLERIWFFLAMTPAALWMSAAIGQDLNEYVGAALCAALGLLCGLLGFLAVFSSVRRGAAGMAVICQEELFERAGRVRHALGMLAGIVGGGAMLMALVRESAADVTNGMLFAFSCALWPMLSMQGNHLAGRVRNEKEMLSAAAGGCICAALVAMLSVLPRANLPLNVATYLILTAGVLLSWLAAWLLLCRIGGEAMHALLERPLRPKKRGAWPEKLLCVLLSALLAVFAGGWLFIAGTALCALCVILDTAACLIWLRRIGRGLF